MKKVSLLLVSLLTVFVTSLSMVAFAAPSDENPYKNHYTKEAQAIRKQGTAKIVYDTGQCAHAGRHHAVQYHKRKRPGSGCR